MNNNNKIQINSIKYSYITFRFILKISFQNLEIC